MEKLCVRFPEPGNSNADLFIWHIKAAEAGGGGVEFMIHSSVIEKLFLRMKLPENKSNSGA